MEKHIYRYLKSLSDSDYQVVDGEPNIIGWEVKNEAGAFVGEIHDLLFDPETNAVRYLIIDLENNGMSLGNKKVMVPIGVAHLHTSDDEVVLPNIHIDQFGALPAYDENATTAATEVEIREVIGSPAALRIEEKIAELDQQQFYEHHHFNKNNFYRRGGTGQTYSGDRTTEKIEIHELIENSKAHDLHAATDQTGIGTHHNEGKRIDEKDQETDERSQDRSPFSTDER